MSSLRNRERFLRLPPRPKELSPVVVPEPEPQPEAPKPAPKPTPFKSDPDFRTRDDCPTCNSQRDDLGRLPIGRCGPDCVPTRPR